MEAEQHRALVIGASGGIGAAIASRLDADPSFDAVHRLSRRDDGFDLSDETTVRAAADRLSGQDYDLIINATGVLDVGGAGPEKAFREIDPAVMIEAFRINAVGAALALKHFAPRLDRTARSVFATLSARVGSIGDNRLGGWMSYRASKAALNQVVRCAAIEMRRRNPDAIAVALHPGTIKTPLTENFARGRYTASSDECAANLLGVLAALTPADSGGFFDYAGKPVPW